MVRRGDDLVALPSAPVVAVVFAQQQHGIAGGVFDAVATTLNGETEMAGVSEFGVFGFSIHIVIQLHLACGEQPGVA